MTTTESSTHCLDCIEFQVKRYREIAAFSKKYPHHCVDCGASGLYSMTYDNTTGDTDIEFCEFCLSRGKCPRCGVKVFNKKYLDGELAYFMCSECGWDDGAVTAPDLPDCICSVEEQKDDFPF